MSRCDDCGQEMKEAVTCTHNAIIICGDTVYKRDTYHFEEMDGRCHDCGIVHGGIHHSGCDVERCPMCKGQFISCGCEDEDSIKIGDLKNA